MRDPKLSPCAGRMDCNFASPSETIRSPGNSSPLSVVRFPIERPLTYNDPGNDPGNAPGISQLRNTCNRR
jgi:hypothetical protein